MDIGARIKTRISRSIEPTILYITRKTKGDGYRRSNPHTCTEFTCYPTGYPYGPIISDFGWLGGDLCPFKQVVDICKDQSGRKTYIVDDSDTWGATSWNEDKGMRWVYDR